MELSLSGMREGAILEPTEAPTTTPTSEKTPARKPVLAPRKTATTMKMAMNRSRTLTPAKSICGFYPTTSPLPPPVGRGTNLTRRCRVRTQPQRGVLWLHRLPHDRYQFRVQTIQVRLVPEPGRERFQGLSRVVAAPVEAPVDKR